MIFIYFGNISEEEKFRRENTIIQSTQHEIRITILKQIFKMPQRNSPAATIKSELKQNFCSYSIDFASLDCNFTSSAKH